MSRNQHDGELGWDDEIQNDSVYTIFPAGVYEFEIVAKKIGRHEPKPDGKLPPCQKVELTVRVYGVDGEYNDIRHTLYMHRRLEGVLCAFFKAIGQRKHGEALKPRWEEVVGSSGRCKVAIHSWIGDDGKERQRNDVKAFLDPADFPDSPPPIVTPLDSIDDVF